VAKSGAIRLEAVQSTAHAQPNLFKSRANFVMDMKVRHPTLGSLLRGLRSRKGWTLKEMSERTGIPVSTLSKVEHDRLTLTYDKLLQISPTASAPIRP
jgi:hypothetical protein